MRFHDRELGWTVPQLQRAAAVWSRRRRIEVDCPGLILAVWERVRGTAPWRAGFISGAERVDHDFWLAGQPFIPLLGGLRRLQPAVVRDSLRTRPVPAGRATTFISLVSAFLWSTPASSIRPAGQSFRRTDSGSSIALFIRSASVGSLSGAPRSGAVFSPGAPTCRAGAVGRRNPLLMITVIT